MSSRGSSWSSIRQYGPIKRCWLVVRADCRCSWCGAQLTRRSCHIDHIESRLSMRLGEAAHLRDLKRRGIRDKKFLSLVRQEWKRATHDYRNVVAACAGCNARRESGEHLKLMNSQQLNAVWVGPRHEDALTQRAIELAAQWYSYSNGGKRGRK